MAFDLASRMKRKQKGGERRKRFFSGHVMDGRRGESRVRTLKVSKVSSVNHGQIATFSLERLA